METETLGQLITLFAQLGAEAKWAFIVWLGYKAFVVLACAGTLLTIVRWIVTATTRANATEDLLRSVCGALGMSYYSERHEIVDAVRALKKP